MMKTINVKDLMQVGGAKKEYYMDFVPLRIGVKIRPDRKFYNNDALDMYKSTS